MQVIEFRILPFCPKCGGALSHVNALDTEARLYLVWCPNFRCRFVREYTLEEIKKLCR